MKLFLREPLILQQEKPLLSERTAPWSACSHLTMSHRRSTCGTRRRPFRRPCRPSPVSQEKRCGFWEGSEARREKLYRKKGGRYGRQTAYSLCPPILGDWTLRIGHWTFQLALQPVHLSEIPSSAGLILSKLPLVGSACSYETTLRSGCWLIG